jgi:hypothetical protein
MTDWVSISEVATAGGTMILAVATFASIRAGQRSARIAERSLLAAQRPLLIPSREDDPTERIGFYDGVRVEIRGHRGVVVEDENRLFLALGLRNGGTGIAVIHGWQVRTETTRREVPDDIETFRLQTRDLYIPASFTGFWQGAVRDPDDSGFAIIKQALDEGSRVVVDLLYGDQEGGQRAIARFSIPTREEDPLGARAEVIRYWSLDGIDPRWGR